MNNKQRLELETKGIQLSPEELTIYLQESNLDPQAEYRPQSATNKSNIYRSALAILESIANNPANLKSYKIDDMTISNFAESLMDRIDQLDRKIRLLKDEDEIQNESIFHAISRLETR